MFFKQLSTRDASLSYFFGCAGERVLRDLPPQSVEMAAVAVANAGLRHAA